MGFGITGTATDFHDGKAGGAEELAGLVKAGLGDEAKGAGLEL